MWPTNAVLSSLLLVFKDITRNCPKRRWLERGSVNHELWLKEVEILTSNKNKLGREIL